MPPKGKNQPKSSSGGNPGRAAKGPNHATPLLVGDAPELGNESSSLGSLPRPPLSLDGESSIASLPVVPSSPVATQRGGFSLASPRGLNTGGFTELADDDNVTAYPRSVEYVAGKDQVFFEEPIAPFGSSMATGPGTGGPFAGSNGDDDEPEPPGSPIRSRSFFGAPVALLADNVGASDAADGGAAAAPHVRFDDGHQPDESQWDARLRYLKYYFAISMWLPKYSFRERLLGDVVAGLSIGAMLVPQAIAYGSIVGVPPVYGLVTAFFSGLVYFLLGNSPVLTVGPEATTSMMLGQIVANLPAIRDAKAAGQDITGMTLEAAASISMLAGLITLGLGLLRLGFVDSVFSRPVLSGFVCAVGMLLLTDQTPKLLGLPPCLDCEEEFTPTKFRYLWRNIVTEFNVNTTTAIIGISCVAFLFIMAYVKKRYAKNKVLSVIPHIFLMVIATVIISYALDLKHHVRVLGGGDSAFPGPRLPVYSSSTFSTYFTGALGLSILGFVETHLVNKLIPESGLVSPNRELVALGAMHLVTSLFGGYTAYGSLARTRVSVSIGASSPFVVLTAAIMILFAVLFFMGAFAVLPVAVPASIIFYVGTVILEFHEIVLCFNMRQWTDFGLACLMVVVTFLFNVDIGLMFAFGACLLLLIKHQKRPAVRLMGRMNPHTGRAAAAAAAAAQAEGESQRRSHVTYGGEGSDAAATEPYYEVEEGINLHHEELEGILIYQIDGPLFFSNSEGLKDRTRRIEYFGNVVSHPSEPIKPLALKGIIFDLSAVTSIDSSASQVIKEIIEDYNDRGVPVFIVKLRRALYDMVVAAGIIEVLGHQNLLRDIETALKRLEAKLDSDAAGAAAAATAAATAATIAAEPQLQLQDPVGANAV